MTMRILNGTAGDFAWSTLCHVCGKTWISCTRRFPNIYVCGLCRDSKVDHVHIAWMAAHPRCANGHVLTEVTVGRLSTGKHYCRLCKAESDKRQRAARDAKTAL